MARKIAIELEVNGVKESVNTIGELETAIEQLTEELKNTDIGSERFQQLTNELNTAKSELKAFEQTFEGLDPQQKTQAYLAFGESVVSGVLLAQEALRAFGIENEEVNAAVEKSTQAINIALQARIVIEGILEARVIATTLAQRALNTATVAGSRALKILFTTIAANPVGALLTAIGLLVTAFIALSDTASDAEKATEKLNEGFDEAEKKSKRAAIELEFYADIVKDTTKSEEERAVALEELNKLGVITDGITLDNVESLDKLNERLELATENIYLKSQAEAASALLTEALKKQLEAQNSELEDNLAWYEKGLFFIQKYTSVVGFLVSDSQKLAKAQENQTEAINETTSEAEKYEQIYLEILENLNKNEAKLKKQRDDAKKDIDDQNRRFENFKRTITSLSNEIDILNRDLLKFGEVPSPPIVEELEKLIELQTQYITLTEESRKTLGDTFKDFFRDVSDAVEGIDLFGKTYEDTRKELTKAFRSGDVEAFETIVQQTQDLYLGANSEFNAEQRRTIAQLLSGYSTAFAELQQFGIDTTEEFDNIVSPLLDSLAQKLRLEGELTFVRRPEEDVIRETTEDLDSLLFKLTQFGDSGVLPSEMLSSAMFAFADGISLSETELTDLITTYNISIDDIRTGTEDFYKTRDLLVSNFTQEFLKNIDLETIAEEDRAEARQKAVEQAEELTDKIIETITATAKQEDAIRGVYNEVEDAQNQLVENQQRNAEILLGLIIENFGEIEKVFNFDFLDPTADLEKNFKVITDFFSSIGVEGVDILFKTEEEKLEIIEFFLKKRQELLEENADKEKETQEDLLQTTFDNYAEIVNGLNQLTLSLSEASQLQIERVEANTQEALSNIVGDTEEAEKLRTEIQEESNEKIVEIERRSRLRELQFTKIQATADLAQALINALKLPPPFNAIQSAIIGTAGSIQIATIQGQIDDLQSAQGFATGGYVEGPGSGTSDSIPAMLSNGEFVVNAKATQKFLPLLEEINDSDTQFRKFANGGYVLDTTIPTTSTIQNIFDDSRIIEELRKTRQEPLRAYVFEKDITEAQQIEKRLQELSKL